MIYGIQSQAFRVPLRAGPGTRRHFPERFDAGIARANPRKD